jgi:hypothetical protein
MTVGQLKARIAELLDSALVLTDTRHSVVEARARVGTAEEPNSMGFTSFSEDLYEYPAVLISSPL